MGYFKVAFLERVQLLSVYLFCKKKLNDLPLSSMESTVGRFKCYYAPLSFYVHIHNSNLNKQIDNKIPFRLSTQQKSLVTFRSINVLR